VPTVRDAGAAGTLHEPLVLHLPSVPASSPARPLVARPRLPGGDRRSAAGGLGGDLGGDGSVRARRSPRLGAHPLRGAADAPEQRQPVVRLAAGPPVADQLARVGGQRPQRSAHQPSLPGAPLACVAVDARLTVWVGGRVQGVGFRWWTRARALELGLSGWAANLDDGRVEVVAEGPREACERLLAALSSGRTPGRVVGVTHRWADALGVAPGFVER